jgi:hypothetical protein
LAWRELVGATVPSKSSDHGHHGVPVMWKELEQRMLSTLSPRFSQSMLARVAVEFDVRMMTKH